MKDWIRDAEQYDDLTFIVMKVRWFRSLADATVLVSWTAPRWKQQSRWAPRWRRTGPCSLPDRRTLRSIFGSA